MKYTKLLACHSALYTSNVEKFLVAQQYVGLYVYNQTVCFRKYFNFFLFFMGDKFFGFVPFHFPYWFLVSRAWRVLCSWLCY